MLIHGGQAASRGFHRSLFIFSQHPPHHSVSPPLLRLSPLERCSVILLLPSPFPRRRWTTKTALRFLCSLPADSHEPTPALRLSQRVADGSDKARLDAWLASRMETVSRARIQASIRAGLVLVNGNPVKKVSQVIRKGDWVDCSVAELEPLRAKPENIPINIVYEDAHVLVVNKPPHMVVHPAPGHPSGTLVNAILHHCGFPAVGLDIGDDSSDAEDDAIDLHCDEFDELLTDKRSAVYDDSMASTSIRPGIVHRLDKGTSGLLVVAKDVHSHAHLAEQFKAHTIHRVYISLTAGVPVPSSGRLEIPIARDSNNRIRMTAVPCLNNNRRARFAASRYRVIEVLAGGGAALVEWRLETGRTHQIRAHAKYLGIPLLGDEVYGGTEGMVLSRLQPKTPSCYHSHLFDIVSNIQRPCLHALTLGFRHPRTGEDVKFSCPPASDFTEVLCTLRKIGTKAETSPV
ncbi:RNA pseudouridine synthase 2, chloroplastic-like isoform X1 [Nymphaea colorata]|nr:RNA pseudouridine synthase 2, chloroplastic-like isoform X1 [Nymphaea colorata]